ncbi:hypothetical protein ABW21_db0209325 [Orbilia brochopaga]|nr:hypothetical protein ABW21_db0209325 [Drechslerella brochopaga]
MMKSSRCAASADIRDVLYVSQFARAPTCRGGDGPTDVDRCAIGRCVCMHELYQQGLSAPCGAIRAREGGASVIRHMNSSFPSLGRSMDVKVACCAVHEHAVGTVSML